METVKAVPKRERLSCTIIGMRSSSSRCPMIGRQISPRPYLAMKLMASGVTFSAAMHRSPSFSRSSSSTMITNFPARKSSMASSTVAKGMATSSTMLHL